MEKELKDKVKDYLSRDLPEIKFEKKEVVKEEKKPPKVKTN